jgi:hypothetical protein
MSLAITGLVEIVLPGRTVRLCDGGRIVWGSDAYTGRDSVFGVIASISNLAEGIAGELPKLDLTFHPATDATPADLSDETWQGSGVRFWIADYNPETGTVTGTPDLQFDGQLDQTVLTIGEDSTDLAMTVVPRAERLLTRNSGNSLSPTFHKSTVSESLWCMATYDQSLCVIYSWYPLVIGTIDYSKSTLSLRHIHYHVPPFFKHVYTATNSVPWEDTQWVVLTKPVSYILNNKKYIKYEYLLVVLNTNAEVLRYSEFFTVEENGYISDMQLHPEHLQFVYTTPQGKCCIARYMWDSIHTMRWIHNSTCL